MKNYRISRVYLENYKLFRKKEIKFSNSLTIFDGPNGYGKTSIFEAIEFLITGDIKRITGNNSINKNTTFETVVIAGDQEKDVNIKAEFVTKEGGTLVIAKRIPAIIKPEKKKKYNPASLCSLTQTFKLPDYDCNDYKTEFKVSQKDIDNIFGKEVIDFFDLFFYIKQEERLDFFKRNEKERMDGINSLFKMEQEKGELGKANKSLRRLNGFLKKLRDKQKQINTDINELKISTNQQKRVDYKKLFVWKKDAVSWDHSEFLLTDIKKKNEIVNELKGIYELKKHFINFKCEKANDWYTYWLEKKSMFPYFVALYPHRVKLESMKTAYNSLKFFKEQEKLAATGSFEKLNYPELSRKLDIKIELKQIETLVMDISNLDKNASDLAKAASEINKTRESLYKRVKSFRGAELEGKCVYCGFDWGNKEKLINQFTTTTDIFNNLSDRNTEQKADKINELKDIYQNILSSKILHYKNEVEKLYDLDNDIFDYIFEEKNKVEEQFKLFTNGFKIYCYDIKYAVSELTIVNFMRYAIKSLPVEYLKVRNQFKFQDIFTTYFGEDENKVNMISVKEIENKINYIEWLYFNNNVERLKKLKEEYDKYCEDRKVFEEEIIPQVEEYRAVLKSNIELYQNKIIKNIEIPFYIYTGRIMQSYQGGLGILIKEQPPEVNAGGEVSDNGLKSIRFISPSPDRQEHDIIYTLSSGQLSAVIISFTLALNKIYSDDGCKSIFIDDPVQCMDELNIASFVELLRNEFSDRQLIMSTHEDSFSRYIRYKYLKYGLDSKAITLKGEEMSA